MADIVVQTGRMVFKMNTGEIRDDKPVYRRVTLGGVKGDAAADNLAAVAGKVTAVLPWPVEQIELQRAETLAL